MFEYKLTYNRGRGHMTIDLDEFLPANAQKLRILLDTIERTDTIDTDAGNLHSYIAGRVNALQKARAEAANKAQIGKLTAQIAAYCRNSEAIAKRFNLPAITDDDEAIKFKKGTAHAMESDNAHTRIMEYAGYTFTRYGYDFEVYRRSPNCMWNVILSGTGLSCASVYKRDEIAGTITREFIAKIEKLDLAAMYANYRRIAGIDAGEPVATEQDSTNAGETVAAETAAETPETTTAAGDTTTDTTTTNAAEPVYTFTADAITINGTTYPVEYTISKQGTVNAFAIVSVDANGRKHKQAVRIPQEDDNFAAAMEAAAAAGAPDYRPATKTTTAAAETVEEVSPAADTTAATETVAEAPETTEAAEDTTTTERPATDTTAAETAEPATDTRKAARGPVPEKTFVGTTIQGRGWKIFFDPDAERTRIILTDDAAPEVKAAVLEAGFYYSSKLKSYNKKLTFKAYRAAKALAAQLNAA